MRPAGRCALLSVMVLSLSAALSADDPSVGRKLAVVVGINAYRANSGLRNLSTAASDAEALSTVLREQGFLVQEMTHEVARQPGRETSAPNLDYICDAIDGILSYPNLGANDAVLISFCGHGVQYVEVDEAGNKSPRFYFCPADATVKGVKSVADLTERNHLLPLDELYMQLADCTAATKLLIVDACRNDPSQPGTFRDTLESITLPKLPPPPGGIAAFFSCKANELAAEDTDLQGGVFSHFLVQGLRGAADQPLANRPADGIVTFAELSTYVANNTYAHVFEKYRVKQSPELRGEFDLNLPLARIDQRQRLQHWARQILRRAQELAITQGVNDPERMLTWLYHISEQYLRLGDIEGVRECMRAASVCDRSRISYDGTDDYQTTTALVSLAIAHAWEGDVATARQIVETVAESDMHWASLANFNTAVAIGCNGDRQQALSLLGSYLVDRPADGHYVIHHYMQLGAWDEALQVAQGGEGDNPLYALRLVAERALALRETEPANRALDALIAAATRPDLTGSELGWVTYAAEVLRRGGRPHQATEILERALASLADADFSDTSTTKDEMTLMLHVALKNWDEAAALEHASDWNSVERAKAFDGQVVDFEGLKWHGGQVTELATYVQAQQRAGHDQEVERVLRVAMNPPAGGEFEENYGISLYTAVLASQLAALERYDEADALLAAPAEDLDDKIYRLRRCAQEVYSYLGYPREI
jgi:uncharacterized caspase-like protein